MRLKIPHLAKVSRHIVIVAGEASGDHHAAMLVQHIKRNYPDWRFTGIGGQLMAAQDVELLTDLARYGVTGLTEVLTHLRIIRSAFYDLKQHLQQQPPDLLILVDYPGFNLRVAKLAKALGIQVLYYISPQVWAWKKGRIQHIRQYVDMMAVILPFERQIYQQAGIPVKFVGHPLTDFVKAKLSADAFRAQLAIPTERRIITLLPGSRRNEIKRLLPIIIDSALLLKRIDPNLHFVMPIAPTLAIAEIKAQLQQRLKGDEGLHISIINGQVYDALQHSHCAITCSGTVTLEATLLQTPMVIIYRSSWLTYIIARLVIKVSYLGLCNLLANKKIVPELLQYAANPEAISTAISNYLENPEYYQQTRKALQQISHQLSKQAREISIDELAVAMASEITP